MTTDERARSFANLNRARQGTRRSTGNRVQRMLKCSFDKANCCWADLTARQPVNDMTVAVILEYFLA